MNLEFISVVIPTRNRCDLLLQTLKALQGQTYPHDRFEVIIVDNDSQDGTEQMVRQQIIDSEFTLRYIRKNDEGPGTARNLGILSAVGTIVAFTDSDCAPEKHWLESGVRRFEDDVGLVQGRTLPLTDLPSGEITSTQTITRESGLYETCNIFYRKELLEQVGGFSPEFIGIRFGRPGIVGEDTDLAWKVKKLGYRSIFAEDTIVYHHVFTVHPLKSIFSFRTFYSFYYAVPMLTKKHPELRKTVLYRQFFWTRDMALFDLTVISVFLAMTMNSFFLILSLPLIFRLGKVSFSGISPGRVLGGFRVFFIRLLAHTVVFILLLTGSLRYRSLVL